MLAPRNALRSSRAEQQDADAAKRATARSAADDERQRASRPSFEFGVTAAKEIDRVDELLDLAKVTFNAPERRQGERKGSGFMLFEGLDKAINDLENEIANAQAQNRDDPLLYKVPSIGKIIASVIAASVPTRACSSRDAISPPGSASTRGKTQAVASRALGAIARPGEPIHQETARVGGDLADVQ